MILNWNLFCRLSQNTHLLNSGVAVNWFTFASEAILLLLGKKW